MKKSMIMCVLASSLVVPPVFAGINFDKDPDSNSLRIARYDKVTLNDLEYREASLMKALNEVKMLKAECAKAGVTKVVEDNP